MTTLFSKAIRTVGDKVEYYREFAYESDEGETPPTDDNLVTGCLALDVDTGTVSALKGSDHSWVEEFSIMDSSGSSNSDGEGGEGGT